MTALNYDIGTATKEELREERVNSHQPSGTGDGELALVDSSCDQKDRVSECGKAPKPYILGRSKNEWKEHCHTLLPVPLHEHRRIVSWSLPGLRREYSRGVAAR